MSDKNNNAGLTEKVQQKLIAICKLPIEHEQNKRFLTIRFARDAEYISTNPLTKIMIDTAESFAKNEISIEEVINIRKQTEHRINIKPTCPQEYATLSAFYTLCERSSRVSLAMASVWSTSSAAQIGAVYKDHTKRTKDYIEVWEEVRKKQMRHVNDIFGSIV
jgi:hypothetical protein